tara:strand:+ start:91 stop:318 length:228 start_codon:yes stop_codon:yes gene_type:complete
MLKPEDYLHIKVWGIKLGSLPGYVNREMKLACKANAPVDVIYRDTDDNWIDLSDGHPDVRKEVNAAVARLKESMV